MSEKQSCRLSLWTKITLALNKIFLMKNKMFGLKKLAILLTERIFKSIGDVFWLTLIHQMDFQQERYYLRISQHFNLKHSFPPSLLFFLALLVSICLCRSHFVFLFHRYALSMEKQTFFFMRILNEGKRKKGQQSKGQNKGNNKRKSWKYKMNTKTDYMEKRKKHKEYLSILNVRPLLCHYTIHNFTNTMRL